MTAPTLPAPTPPPTLSDGGRTGIRIALITAATLLVVGTLGTLGTVAWGLSTFRVTTDTQNLPATMRSLAIDTGNMPVALRLITDREVSEPRAELRLINSIRGGSHRLIVGNDAGGTRVALEGESTPWLQWTEAGEITVTLPPDQARRLSVTTQQETGVLLAQADLDQLIARTTDGEVILSGAARRIEAHSRNGDVATREPILVTESFSADTADGDIAVDLRDAAPRTVEVTSRRGDVVLALPDPGPYLVRAQSGDSTQVRVPETDDPADAAAQITARSDDGDVVVEELGLGRR
jgi:Putative adhesin